ncbi:MAG TPA: hypothetical protein VM759_01370 [Longimicrobium sp.]|nr:hypothetical protein [Longimicrobium sp.]
MRRSFLSGWLMVVAALVSAACDTPTQGVPADTHPPVLLAVSFSPATVDVSRGPAETLLTLHVTDEGSGTEWVYVDLQSPGATHFAGCDEPSCGVPAASTTARGRARPPCPAAGRQGSGASGWRNSSTPAAVSPSPFPGPGWPR